VVEDDADAREALIDVLEVSGYSAASARNGREALDYLRSAPSPDLIILDLMMPEMDGWEFRRRQMSDPHLARVPVIVVSALDESGIEANDVLIKPIDIDRLLKMVSHYVGPGRNT
jgi:CheY-like chemotaxis protein